MDAIALKPERRAQLEEYAKRRGKGTDEALDEALAAYLEWERQDYSESLESIDQASADITDGRTKSASEFLRNVARKHGLPR